MHIRMGSFAAAALTLGLVPPAASPGTLPLGRDAFPVRTHPVAHLRRPAVTTYCSSKGTGGFVGGGASNFAGGANSGVLDGQFNQACDQLSGVGSGAQNAVFNNGTNGAEESFIAGGDTNLIQQYRSFIGAGSDSVVNSPNAFIGAGTGNGVDATGYASFIGAGSGNLIGGNDAFIGAGSGITNAGNNAFVGAGASNDLFFGANFAFLGGGSSNAIPGTASFAFLGGGYGNTVSGPYAVIAGGYDNTASGNSSFAGGQKSVAATSGAFVWSDAASGATQLKSTVADQFLVRASGGTKFYSNATLTSGVSLAAGSGSWSSLSDRTMKTAIVPLDDVAVLDKVVALPVSEWSYTSENGVRHVGPMAQDFYAAFKIGEDDRHITTIDEDGVALAAIKGLYAKSERTNAALRDQLAAVQARLATLAARVDALEKR